MLWQLKKISTGEVLNEAGPLPENWGPIFGLEGIKDKLDDLSWLGEAYADMAWVEVEGELEELVVPSQETIILHRANAELRDSDWTMLPDSELTVGEKEAWIEYRHLLRNIRSATGFPDNILWPPKPS